MGGVVKGSLLKAGVACQTKHVSLFAITPKSFYQAGVLGGSAIGTVSQKPPICRWSTCICTLITQQCVQEEAKLRAARALRNFPPTRGELNKQTQNRPSTVPPTPRQVVVDRRSTSGTHRKEQDSIRSPPKWAHSPTGIVGVLPADKERKMVPSVRALCCLG